MRLNLRTRQRLARTAQQGLGLVELMVGITVGLIVAAGAAMVATQQITEHRRLMLEVQMQQDLRIAADMIQQNLKRVGFRGAPANGVWEPAHNVGSSAEVPAKPAASSPYVEITQSNGPGSQDIFFQYAKVGNTSNVVGASERYGFKLENGTLFVQLGLLNGQPNWQAITDPDAVTITSFQPTIATQQIRLDDVCPCPPNVICPTAPTQTVRRVDVTITAVSKADASVQRTLNVSENIRADDVSGECPFNPSAS